MSLLATCGWTLVRTVVLCLIAWPICQLIERTIQSLSSARRAWLLAGLLAPFCFPELVVGYVFRDLALIHPRWAEALCAGLLLIRLIPVGTIALLIAPPAELDAITPAEYAQQRAAYIKAGHGKPAAGAIPLPESESDGERLPAPE